MKNQTETSVPEWLWEIMRDFSRLASERGDDVQAALNAWREYPHNRPEYRKAWMMYKKAGYPVEAPDCLLEAILRLLSTRESVISQMPEEFKCRELQSISHLIGEGMDELRFTLAGKHHSDWKNGNARRKIESAWELVQEAWWQKAAKGGQEETRSARGEAGSKLNRSKRKPYPEQHQEAFAKLWCEERKMMRKAPLVRNFLQEHKKKLNSMGVTTQEDVRRIKEQARKNGRIQEWNRKRKTRQRVFGK